MFSFRAAALELRIVGESWLAVSFAQSQQENSHWAKDKIKTLFLLHNFCLSETVPAKVKGGHPLSLCPHHFGFRCWPHLQYKFSGSLWEREKSSQKRKTWLWLTVSEVSLRGCAAPSLLGMWQGSNIMTEGKLFTSCRQGRDWEQEERCGREDQTHVQQPSSNYHLASNSPFSGKLINGLIHR